MTSNVCRALTGFLLVLFCINTQPANAELAGITPAGSGLTTPVFVTSPPNDGSRLFTVGLLGKIQIVNAEAGTTNPTPFLEIPDTFAAGEGGLLGLAFHPDYENNGKFYTYSTVDNGDTMYNGRSSPYNSHIREYTVSSDPNLANPEGREILSWVQPTTLHNSGWIGFNPALNPGDPQYLYIASGDGGDRHVAEDDDTLLGKILRIDVNGDDFPDDASRNYAIPPTNPFVGEAVREEIFASGLRNPWRSSFDPVTGDLWIGDVGEGRIEEVNLIPADSGGGQNFAWPRMEGSLTWDGGPEPGDVPPVYEYSHGAGPFQGNAIIGGYVYRGPDPELYGRYVFADNPRKRIWSFDPADPNNTVVRWDDVLPVENGTVRFPVSMGSDANRNLYIVSTSGQVFRFVTDALLPGDYDANGVVDSDDYAVFRSGFGSTEELAADGNGDGVVNAADYTVWRDNLGRSVADADASGLLAPEPASVCSVAAGFSLLLAYGARKRR